MFRSAAYLRYLRASTGLSGGYPAVLDEALRHPKLLVIGDAGSGKTTFLRHMAYLWAGAMLDVRTDTLLFPLLLQGEDVAAQPDLAAVMAAQNQKLDWGLDEEFFRVRLASGACLLLIDGLHQIPEGGSRIAARSLLEQQSATGPLNRVIVASRPCPGARLAGFVTQRIGPAGA